MTPLRQRMHDALVLHGMAARTQWPYIDAVARLARHYRRSPDQLSNEQVQRYLLHLLQTRHLWRSTVNQAGCAFRFLYGTVLGQAGEAFQIPLARAPQKLLRLEHIDAAADRTCVRVLQGKGAKDRYVPLAADLLAALRGYWRVVRPRQWLFPGYGDAAQPVDIKTAQRWYRRARDAAGITKAGGIHSLRHYAESRVMPSGCRLVWWQGPVGSSGSA